MKRVRFTNKKNNTTKEMLVGSVGESVFSLCQNVKETNDAIRWCNQHNIGDSFDCDLYSLEIVKF